MKAPSVSRHVRMAVAAALLTMLDWLVWLGWDQRYDVHPDGSVSGPYEAWQVIGFVLVLVVAAGPAAWRGHAVATLAGATAGMAVATTFDWSDDASGLWLVGAFLMTAGTLVLGGVYVGLIAFLRNQARRTSGLPRS
ncbi:hypothetical protein GCM10023085_09510 [Actinomadura viridis]|uniref:RDD family membrane protein YckC n=1 Tax=Actinomadura viridis TaxID=58110 RepID=A0A931DNS9_9ACTN|nr:hypothetical protein [Actinomadura viridis]MBG6091963.1 putative RDD family membrane protein YckC [Actinomadura viridis]